MMLLASASGAGGALRAATPAEPQLLSVYPIGGQAGTTYRATVRGRALAGAYAVWFGATGVEGEIAGFEADADRPGAAADKARTGPKTVQSVEIEFRLTAEAPVGGHSFRLITPHGLSNSLEFYVHDEAAVLEQSGVHELPPDATPIANLPAAIHGRIAESGEVDYYSFTARAGEELRFAAFSSEAMDPAIAIYEPTGSWFDPNRATRLAFHDEDVACPDLTTEPSLEYRFEKDGTYLVRVNGFWGYGGADHSYVLLLTSARAEDSEKEKKDSRDPDWEERTWTRKLDPERMKSLWHRAVPELAPQKESGDGQGKGAVATMGEIPVVDADAEPTSLPVEPPLIPVPALVVGTIERPGDIDRVRFSVKEGDKLVLEVETPQKTIPLMNPYLRVIDQDGVEAFTNVYSRVNANGNISKQIQPKTAYAFPREGSFTLEIRDITANYGDREMSYRVLVRPQVPHLGRVRVAEDHINIFAGEAKKLTIVTEQEEGYDGFALLSVEGLPPGVQAAPATEVEPETPPPFSEGKKERFTTESEKATFVFLSSPDAEPTRTPVKATVYAQPVVNGKLGPRMAVKDILVMLLRPEPEPGKDPKPVASGGSAGAVEK
jgi:hypothetical protein